MRICTCRDVVNCSTGQIFPQDTLIKDVDQSVVYIAT